MTGGNDQEEEEEGEDLQTLVFLAASSDESGNLAALAAAGDNDEAREERERATKEILRRIQTKKVPVVTLLQKMDSTLTSENERVRGFATEVLMKCVRALSIQTMVDEDATQRMRESLLLTQFFAAKLRELCTLKHGLDGMLFSLRCLKRAMNMEG